ncbi:MAG TPA: S8 family serine peptidase [Bryobacteraceae bacterium]|nr:S8 family serine peptidase [Bryobacteraceae bacterium]
MKIAIIDSGVHADHPHVRGVAGGVGVTTDGLTADFLDRLGHGTAVAAAIREKIGADADLYAVKVFDRRLSATIDTIIRALEWCTEEQMDLVNLSLGTSNPAHRERFELALTNGPLVVSAAHALPGDLSGVIGVAADPGCPRDSYRYDGTIFYASPFPRPIPGVPTDQNLQGVSFAVANMTGLIARQIGKAGRSACSAGNHDQLLAMLITGANSASASLTGPC